MPKASSRKPSAQLYDEFQRRAEDSWYLHFTTYTREEALRVADFIARAIEPRFFHDPDNIPLIVVTGGFNHGKSMICEAMSRSILDDEGIEAMIKEGQKFHHYLETAPSSALSNYCYQFGMIAGKPGLVTFDRMATASFNWGEVEGHTSSRGRLCLDEEFVANFKRHAFVSFKLNNGFGITSAGPIDDRGYAVNFEDAFVKMELGGAIFTSGRIETLEEANPWIHFHIAQPDHPSGMNTTSLRTNFGKGKKTPLAEMELPELFDDHDPRHPKWRKVFDLEVLAPELQQSPRFQLFWKKIQEYAATGRLVEPTLNGCGGAQADDYSP
jgi:hypothetical protein